MANVEIKLLSSLDKIFGNEITLSPSRTFGSMLMNDLYSFQIAVRSELPRVLRLKVISDAPLEIMIYKVGKVPCGLHIYGGMDDDDYISKELKDFPDLLTGYEGSSFSSGTSWLAFWVTLKCTGYPSADPYNVVLSAENENQQIMAAETFKISIIKRELPKQKLIHTEWIYLDSIAQYYNIDLFSEKFWELLANYLETASEFSMNMLLTPVLTPLLNTRPGVVRPDVQLTDVFYDNGRYTFGFDKLRRYIRLASSIGFRFFEIAHLFSQWGCAHSTQVYVIKNGVKRLRFGFDTPALSDDYKEFLTAFLPELKAFLESEGILGRTYFHISDEPALQNISAYGKASGFVRKLLGDECRIFDALSDFDFYSSGVVRIPVPSNDHLDKFLDAPISERWTYYCCAQCFKVSNRFIGMPSYRNRILGVQLYKFGFSGFLHWGFNYWQNFDTAQPINPFMTTDTEKSFPSGDPFLVYPGADGPLLSIRLAVLNEAMQDIRALEMLENDLGKNEVLKIIDEWMPDLSFTEYPRYSSALLDFREYVNKKAGERFTKNKQSDII